MHKTEMGKLGRMKMSHMMADTLPELHAMARMIGVDRKHFQDKPRHPHYDIAKSKRAYAVLYGAKEITMQEMVKIITAPH